MRLHSTHTRDSSLRKLSVINRWLIAASVTLTGVLTDVAAHAFPSKSTHSTTKSGSHDSKHNSAKAQSSTPSRKLDPPAEAPQAATESPAGEEPAPESAPAEEPVPAEPAPEREVVPEAASEPAPAQEAPVEEPSAPIVSGGS